MDLHLRPARPDDHTTFARLFLALETGDGVPDAARFAAQLAPDTSIVEVAGEAVGYVYVQILEGTGYVRHLVVDAPARGRGVGRAVMAAVATRFRDAGCTRWCLNVKPDNAPARALYERCGMTEVHAARVVRLAWGDEERLPAPDVEARVLSAKDEVAHEDAWTLPRGLLAAGRGAGKVSLGIDDADGASAGVASFDPLFPGAFPFRARSLAAARALLEACRAHRVPLVDAEHPWRATGFQVVVEADAALAGALVAIGGRVVLETLHYAGSL